MGIARLNGLKGFDSKQTMADVNVVIETLHVQEERWRCAGRFACVLAFDTRDSWG